MCTKRVHGDDQVEIEHVGRGIQHIAFIRPGRRKQVAFGSELEAEQIPI
jgi:hypothetical protein